MKQKTKKIKPYQKFSAKEKAQAVLSIWSERRRASEVCKELGVQWSQLAIWQNRALEGMLRSLERKNSRETQNIPAIGSRLRKLLDKKLSRHEENQSKLQRRLTKIQEKKEATSQQKE